MTDESYNVLFKLRCFPRLETLSLFFDKDIKSWELNAHIFKYEESHQLAVEKEAKQDESFQRFLLAIKDDAWPYSTVVVEAVSAVLLPSHFDPHSE